MDLKQELIMEIESLNEATEFARIPLASAAKLNKVYYCNDISSEPECIDLNDNRKHGAKGFLLEKTSTESTETFSSRQYSKDSHDDIVTTTESYSTTDQNHFGLERRTHSKDKNEMDLEDTSQAEREMKIMDSLIAIKDQLYLQKQHQELQENKATSSTSSPYGDWAEKRIQACERQRMKKSGRELRIQARIEKHRNQLREEAKEEMKRVETILERKEREGLHNKAKGSISPSMSSPYGDWAEKRRQACERQRMKKSDQETDMVTRELRMQKRLKKHRHRVSKEAKEERLKMKKDCW